jgi:hypothetical protein
MAGTVPGCLTEHLQSDHPVYGCVVRAPHLAHTTAANLEKIFQLAYNLPALTGITARTLLTSALSDALVPKATTADQQRSTPTRSDTHDERPSLPSAIGLLSVDAAVDRAIEALTLGNQETEAIGEEASLVAATPRRAKRFLSTYLVVRARAYAELNKQAGPSDDNSRGLLIMVALMVGTPSVIPVLADENMADGDPTVIEWIARLGESKPALDSADLVRLNDFTAHARSLADVQLSSIVRWRATALRYIALPITQAQGAVATERRPPTDLTDIAG